MAHVHGNAKNLWCVLPKLPFMFLLTDSLQGDLIYLNIAGQPLMVINSPKIAADLLDRRATIYSGSVESYL